MNREHARKILGVSFGATSNDILETYRDKDLNKEESDAFNVLTKLPEKTKKIVIARRKSSCMIEEKFADIMQNDKKTDGNSTAECDSREKDKP